MINNLAKTVILAFVLALPAAVVADQPLEGKSGNAAWFFNPLAGVWQINGQPDEGAPVGPFTNYVTIARDGTFVNVDPSAGTAVGRAVRMTYNSYAVTFFGFLMQGDMSLQYEVNGTLSLTGPGQASGPFRATIKDLDGNPLFGYEGTISAERQQVMPF